jgi:hypothetical protein
MGHRSRKQRQRFACGHRGFGQYCHRCASQSARRRQRRSHGISVSPLSPSPVRQCRSTARQFWRQSFAADPVDLSHLPQKIVLKARLILARLAAGEGFWQVLGQRMSHDRSLIRIPVGYRYRLLCRLEDHQLWPLQVMSHETYNRVARNRMKL